jgi:hypothetical protein
MLMHDDAGAGMRHHHMTLLVQASSVARVMVSL